MILPHNYSAIYLLFALFTTLMKFGPTPVELFLPDAQNPHWFRLVRFVDAVFVDSAVGFV